MRPFGAIVVAWLALATFAPGAIHAETERAQSRFALVIGNSTYQHAPALKDVHGDAIAVADAFSRLGFNVATVEDATFEDFRRALLQFGRAARGADIAVIYYAGHGMVASGENWLLPTDVELKNEVDVDNEAIDVQAVMRSVSTAKSLGLIILDACRQNPFLAGMQRATRTRGIDRGLARVEPNDNILVAYAARDGTTVVDVAGPHSPFTTALLKNIETPGLEIAFLLRNVHDDVLEITHDEQEPAVYGSLSKNEIFLGPASNQEKRIDDAASGPTAEEIAWSFLRESIDQGTLRNFINEYPSGKYVAEAKMRIASLQAPVTLSEPSSPAPDEIGWSYLKDTANAAAIRRFIEQFPESPHIDAARQRIVALDQQPAAATKWQQEEGQTVVSPASGEHGSSKEVGKNKEVVRRVQRNTKAVQSAWRIVQNSGDPYVLRKFADAFPTSHYTTVANQRLAALENDLSVNQQQPSNIRHNKQVSADAR
jgi:hypothetical protein